MIRLFLVASFLTCAASVQGQIHTVVGPYAGGTRLNVGDNVRITIDIPAGKSLEILDWCRPDRNYRSGTPPERNVYLWMFHTYKQADFSGNVRDIESHLHVLGGENLDMVMIKHIAGPNKLVMEHRGGGSHGKAILTYKLTNNIVPAAVQSSSIAADSTKVTDDFLMLDYTVQANTTYKLGISKDLKNWKPLFEFTPESDKLNVELPKIILGNKSFLKLE